MIPELVFTISGIPTRRRGALQQAPRQLPPNAGLVMISRLVFSYGEIRLLGTRLLGNQSFPRTPLRETGVPPTAEFRIRDSF